MKIIISSASSYRLIENQYFKQIINDYTTQKLINRTALKILEDNYYEHKINEIIAKFKKIETAAITTDSWTAKILRKSFISLIVHFLKPDWTPDYIDLGVFNLIGSHTALAMARKRIDYRLPPFKNC